MYFIDANVWIYIIQNITTSSASPQEQIYIDFFEQIIDDAVQPRILMPSVLFSEIVNTYIRQIAFEDFKQSCNNYRLNFKRDFRPTNEHQLAYGSILDDLSSYKQYMHFIDDASILKPSPLYLSKTNMYIDFNDKYYIHLLQEYSKTNRLIIVTNDGDFDVQDIPILTLNRNLLALL
jgi:predicted nucleic acid-binding protein